MGTNHRADRIAEAIKQAIKRKQTAVRQQFRGKKDNGRSRFEVNRRKMAIIGIESVRVERNEYKENFELLLRIVSNMAESGSGDCEAVLAEYSEEYLSSF